MCLLSYYNTTLCFQVTSSQPSTSATERKFSYRATYRDEGSDTEDAEDAVNDITTVITRSSMLSNLVKGLHCLECGAASLIVRVADHRLGLVAAMETVCTECDAVLNSTLTSDRIEGSTAGNVPFFVVRQAVAASMDMGVGHAGLVKLCRFLDIKPLTHTSFTKHVHAICDANKIVVTRMFDEAANTVRRVYSDIDTSIEAGDTIDLTVSYDGSWMTRGHKSQYGIGCVIEVMTGLVIDLQVMSLYCQRCAYASTRHGGVHTRGFLEWFTTHEPECNKNYEGSSGGMEMKAAELLWDRSTNRDFRYTTMLSDGDARTFNHLSSLQLYGDVELQKEECINHVAKRLGTALRKLAASGKKAGVTLGGRGFGKLKQTTINKLTAYYGKAVRDHPNDVSGMQSAILATFEHAISTDDSPQHDRCPVGVDSWCFYQKALATGQEPGPHRVNVGTPLSPDVAKHVKDVYTRLSHVDLLERCAMGRTQNANESLHSVVWSKCPKTSFVGLERVLSATCSAVSQFNAGVETTIRNLCDVMEVPAGGHLLASAEKADHRRLGQAKRQAVAATKEVRQAKRIARTRAAEASDYAAGEF